MPTAYTRSIVVAAVIYQVSVSLPPHQALQVFLYPVQRGHHDVTAYNLSCIHQLPVYPHNHHPDRTNRTAMPHRLECRVEHWCSIPRSGYSAYEHS